MVSRKDFIHRLKSYNTCNSRSLPSVLEMKVLLTRMYRKVNIFNQVGCQSSQDVVKTWLYTVYNKNENLLYPRPSVFVIYEVTTAKIVVVRF